MSICTNQDGANVHLTMKYYNKCHSVKITIVLSILEAKNLINSTEC